MNKQINFNQPGGLHLFQETLAFMQEAYSKPLDAIGALCGDKVIVSGVEAVGGLISDGWLAVNGELIPFTGGAPAPYVVLQTVFENEQFDDGTQKPIYATKKASLGNLGGGDNFPFASLTRLSALKNIWLKGDVKQVHADNAYVAQNFTPTGLGINERAGWAVCNGQNGTFNMGGRVAVGLQFPAVVANPNDNVWDALYNWAADASSGMGKTAGEKQHKLTINEMPPHHHAVPMSDPDPATLNTYGFGAYDHVNPRQWEDLSVSVTSRYTHRTNNTGGDQPHENRQPFIVSLFIQKL